MPVIEDQVGLSLDQILLATDFSPASDLAAGYAKSLAKRFSSWLTLAHVIAPSVAIPSEPAFAEIPIEKLRHDSTEKQERLLTEMTAAGVSAATRTLESQNPAVSIVRLGEQLASDLIITGTHARQGLSRAILGSCAEGIIRHASCPVLTIGPKVKPAPQGPLSFHTVVFATDFSSNTAMEAAVALSFAKDSLSKVLLCHVIDHSGKDIIETFLEELRFEEALCSLIPRSTYDWISPERVMPTGPVAQEILTLARKSDADLIVLGAKRSGTWFTHLVEGTVGRVLAGAGCPVMTVCGQ